MKPKEHGDDDKESNLDQDSDDLNDETDVDGLFLVGDSDDFLDDKGNLTAQGIDKGEDDIEEEEHKELSVAKADTVGNPWAVVVHVEHTTLAGRTMMTSILLHNYLSGFKLWQSKQYLLLRF